MAKRLKARKGWSPCTHFHLCTLIFTSTRISSLLGSTLCYPVGCGEGLGKLVRDSASRINIPTVGKKRAMCLAGFVL